MKLLLKGLTQRSWAHTVSIVVIVGPWGPPMGPNLSQWGPALPDGPNLELWVPNVPNWTQVVPMVPKVSHWGPALPNGPKLEV